MDFVQAKSILDKFAQAHRAAEFMADALDTAASLERRAMELQNNVEHLQKEQAAQQTSLTAMRDAAGQAQAALAEQHAARVTGLRTDHDRLQAGLAAQRATVEQDLTAARARLEDYTERAHATLADLDGRIAEKTATVETLQAQIEALKAQARQVLN